MSGWIKLHRKLEYNPIWLSEPFTRGQAWVDILLITNHKDGFIRKRGIKIPVKRGECGYSQVALAKRWGWSRGKVIRFLNELEIEQQIVQQKNNATSVITVINYDQYQIDGTADSTANGQQTDSKRYRNKNEKNDKNKEEVCEKSVFKKLKRKDRIVFDYDTEQIQGIEKQDLDEWQAAFPAVEITLAIMQAKQWLIDNPTKRKSDIPRFLGNWFRREQERGGGAAKRQQQSNGELFGGYGLHD